VEGKELLSGPIPEPLNNSPGSEEAEEFSTPENDAKKVEEKSNEKSKNHLIFLPPQETSQADLPKFYKKRGRQRTEAKTKALIMYRLERRKWPHGLSDYMQWYYETNYIKRGSKNYGETERWKAEIRRSKIHIVSADHSA
jgi:hypothetical protein